MNGTSSDEPVVPRRRARGTTTRRVDDTKPADASETATGDATAAIDAGNGDVPAPGGDGPVIVAPGTPDETRLVWVDMEMTGLEPDRDRIIDTMTMWAGERDRVSLDNLCRALGIPRKSRGIDGSKVYDMLVSGRFRETSRYCADDVRRLRSVHRVMEGQTPLEHDILSLMQEEDDGRPGVVERAA